MGYNNNLVDPYDFPHFGSEPSTKTSLETTTYNCIAWAAGDKSRWWSPTIDPEGKEGYWPKRLPRDTKISTVTRIFKHMGYTPCKDGSFEPGYLKIAVYAKDGQATHAARQLDDGQWTHKLGIEIDVSTTLKAVEGPVYGSALRYLKKKAKDAIRADPPPMV